MVNLGVWEVFHLPLGEKKYNLNQLALDHQQDDFLGVNIA